MWSLGLVILLSTASAKNGDQQCFFRSEEPVAVYPSTPFSSYRSPVHEPFHVLSAKIVIDDPEQSGSGDGNVTDPDGSGSGVGNSTEQPDTTCPEGFEKNEHKECEDINECESLDLNNCDQNIQQCVNTPGSYSCQCAPGYREDVDICKDIDECKENSHNCLQVCRNLEGGFECDCYGGYELQENGTCTGGATGCKLECEHYCIEGGECRCRIGYKLNSDGYSCDEIDECAEGTDACSHGEYCENTDGAYKCACPDGWKISTDQRTCQPCEVDVKWGPNCAYNCTCEASNTRRCDTVTGCVCRPGWSGDTCDVLDQPDTTTEALEFTTEAPEFTTEALEFTTEALEFTTEAPVPERKDSMYEWEDENYITRELKLDKKKWTKSVKIGMQIFCETYKKFYVSPMGYISFGKKHSVSPYNFPTNDDESNKGGGSKSKEGSGSGESGSKKKKDVLAPFLAETEGCSYSQIKYAHFRSSQRSAEAEEIIAQANGDVHDFEGNENFEATDVVIITWYGMMTSPWSAYYYFCNPDWGSTYQVVLITDGTYTYAMFNYKYNGIWAFNCGRAIRFGLEFQDKKFELALMSGTQWMQFIDKIPGNTGRIGRWMLRLFDPKEGTCNKAEAKCLDWLSRARDGNWLRNRVPACPCNTFQAWLDWRFRFDRADKDSICFKSRQTLSAWYWEGKKYKKYKVQQRCCYAIPWWIFSGPLLTCWCSGHQPGYMTFLKHSPSDSEGHKYCCVESNRFCDYFYDMRPIDTCRRYRPPWRGNIWGDPHFKTLDGVDYTFNGLGEYWMVKNSKGDQGFQMQARTAQAKNAEGNEVSATVFSAFVMKANGTDLFQVQLSPDETTLQLFVNGTKRDDILDAAETDFEDEFEYATLSKNSSNTQMSISFEDGWTVTLSARFGLLSIETVASDDDRDSIGGLLGVFNGSPDDDLTAPDGNTIPQNATDSVIFHQFGKLWTVSEDDTMFTYEDGKTWADYAQNDSYVPLFGCPSKEEEHAAKVICGGEAATEQCIYDYCTTGKENVAMSTQNIGVKFEEDGKVLSNGPPGITVPGSVNATVGTQVTFSINVSDPEGDSVEVNLTTDAVGAAFDTSTYTFTWTPWDMTPVAISFTARDSNGATATADVPIILCSNCSSGQGECDFTEAFVSETVSTFSTASCNCYPGYEGEDCDIQPNACDDNPCAELETECTPLSPEEQSSGEYAKAYTCVCPEGFKDILGACIDIDECNSTETNKCHATQQCVNELGSYRCECTPGYRLDGETCKDIDECAEKSDNCTQVCKNKEGSFTCECHDGWHLDSDGTTCKGGPTNCEPPCDPHFCTEGSICKCKPGYKLNEDGHSCTDIDECTEDTHACSGACHNTEGGYTCSCPDGFKLHSDQRKCQACDEGMNWGANCENSCGTCVVANTERCDTVTGCVCETGWTGSACDEVHFIGVDNIHMIVTLVMTYNADQRDAIISDFRNTIQEVFSHITAFVGINVIDVRSDATTTKIEYQVIYSQHQTDQQKSWQASLLKTKAEVDGGLEILGEKVHVDKVEVVRDGNIGEISSPCSLMDEFNLCNNGQCQEIDDRVECRCRSGSAGEFCTDKILTGGEIAAIVICTLVGIAALVLVTVYFYKWRKSTAPRKHGWGKAATYDLALMQYSRQHDQHIESGY